MAGQQATRRESEAKRILETIAASIGGLLAAGTLMIIVWNAAMKEEAPPFVTVEAIETEASDGGFLLKFIAVNRGDQTVASVSVEGVLKRDGAMVETSDAVLDFVPRRSRSRGGLFFTADPRQHEIVLRAKGYADP